MADTTDKALIKKAAPAQAVVDKTQVNLEPIVAAVKEMVIDSPEAYTNAGDVLGKAKKYMKSFKEQKDFVLKPVKDMVKAYEKVLKPTEEQLKDIEKTIKSKMLEYNEKVTAEAEAEAAKLEQKIENGYIKRPETIVKNMQKIETVNNAEAGVRESMVTKVKVVDWSKIPSEYFARPKVVEAMMVEIRKDALGNKAQGIAPIVIPGTELYQEKSLSM